VTEKASHEISGLSLQKKKKTKSKKTPPKPKSMRGFKGDFKFKTARNL